MALFAAREWHRLVRAPRSARSPTSSPSTSRPSSPSRAIALRRRCADAAVVPGRPSRCWRSARSRPSCWRSSATTIRSGMPAACSISACRRWRWWRCAVLPPQGALIVLGLFLIVWATDTGALVFGKLIGGTEAGAAHVARQDLGRHHRRQHHRGGGLRRSTSPSSASTSLLAMLFALVFSVVAHGGDLFEILRQAPLRHQGFRRSDPRPWRRAGPHGFHVRRRVVLALLVFVLHFNPLFGGHA